MPKRPTKIAVLDYTNNTVTIYTALIEDDSEVIEEYLSNKGHNMSQIYYINSPVLEVIEITAGEKADNEFLNAPYIPGVSTITEKNNFKGIKLPKTPYYVGIDLDENGKHVRKTLKSQALDFVQANLVATSTEIRKFMFETAGHGIYNPKNHRGYYSSYFSNCGYPFGPNKNIIQARFSVPSKDDNRVLTRLANGMYQVDTYKG